VDTGRQLGMPPTVDSILELQISPVYNRPIGRSVSEMVGMNAVLGFSTLAMQP